MKKILVCLLAFCMLFSLFSCGTAKEPSEDVKETAKETKTEEKKPEEPKEKENTETVYEDLTSDYKKLIEFRFSDSFGEKWQDKLHSIQFSDDFRGMIASFMTDDRTDVISQMIEGLDDTFSPKGIGDFGTVLFDLNQDGVQELFWVRRDHSILAVFTVHGGEAVLLDTFWPRHKGYVSGDGELYGYGSGGEKDLRCSVYRLTEEGKLEAALGFSSGIDYFGDPTQVNYFETADSQRKSISSSRFEELSKQYPQEQSKSWMANPIQPLA